MELHQGSISVSADKGEGTSFIIQLPLGRAHLRPEDIAESMGHDDSVDQVQVENENSSPEDLDRDESLPILLIVEDNRDVRTYTRSDLDELNQ